jgi:hypothetical protein
LLTVIATFMVKNLNEIKTIRRGHDHKQYLVYLDIFGFQKSVNYTASIVSRQYFFPYRYSNLMLDLSVLTKNFWLQLFPPKFFKIITKIKYSLKFNSQNC